MTTNRDFPPRGSALWWMALLLLVAGAAISYLMYVSARPGGGHPERLVIAITLCLVGICVVCATSGWWFRH